MKYFFIIKRNDWNIYKSSIFMILCTIFSGNKYVIGIVSFEHSTNEKTTKSFQLQSFLKCLQVIINEWGKIVQDFLHISIVNIYNLLMGQEGA